MDTGVPRLVANMKGDLPNVLLALPATPDDTL
jgi:hypothetical protein